MATKASFLADTGREKAAAFRSCLRRASRNPGEKEIHDLRVSIRRLLAFRAVAGALAGRDDRPSRTARRLKGLMTPLGQLRDAQVKIEWLRKIVPVGDDPSYLYALAVLADATAREERVGNLLRGLRRKDVAGPDGGIDLPPVPGNTLRERAAAILSAREEKVEALAAAARDEANPDALHRMRLAFKRYRYAAEVLAPLFPGLTSEALERLHAFQTLLGTIHDLDVMLEEAGRFRRRVLELDGESLVERRLRAIRHREFHRLAPLIASPAALADRVFFRRARGTVRAEGRSRRRGPPRGRLRSLKR